FAECDEKLAGWRRKATEGMRPLMGANSTPSAQLLARLRSQLAAQSQNVFLKQDLLARTVPVVLLVSLTMVVFFVVTVRWGWYDAIVDRSLEVPLRLGVLAAFLGGVISVALSVETYDIKAKIPAMALMLRTMTLLRPVVGALCAIPVVFLAQSDFLALKTFP